MGVVIEICLKYPGVPLETGDRGTDIPAYLAKAAFINTLTQVKWHLG
jgi:hypothetical protein